MNTIDLRSLASFVGNGQAELPPCLDGQIWLLREGMVDLFVVRGREDDPGFFQRHLFSLEGEGAVLPVAVEGARLKAVPLAGSRLEAVWCASLDAPALERALLPWLDGVGGGLVEIGIGRPEISRFLDAPAPADDEEAVGLQRGQTVSVHGGLLWALPSGAALLPFGREPVDEAVSLTPLTHRLWYSVGEPPAEIGVSATADRLGDGSLWPALQSLGQTLLVLALDHLLRRRLENEERIAARGDSEIGERSHLLAAAARSIDVERLSRGGEAITDGLVLACQRVGRWHGIDVKKDAFAEPGLSEEERLSRMALGSRFQYRRIALRGEWWREDLGALLAFDEATGEPIALVPGSRRRLFRHDGKAPSGQPVTAATAALVAPHAYQFYAPFPEGAKTLKEIFRFGIPGDVPILGAVLMAVIICVLALVPPLMIKVLFSTAIPGSDFALVLDIAVAMGLTYATTILVRIAYETSLARFEGKAAARLQGALFDRVLRLPSSFIQTMFLGKLHSKWMLFEKLHGAGVVRTYTPIILTGGFSFFSLLLMFTFFVMPSVIVLAVTVALLFYASKVGPWQLAAMGRGLNIPGHYWSLVTEALGGIGKLRLSGAEGRAFNRWLGFLVERRVRFLQGMRHRSRFQVVMSLYEGGTLVLVLVILSLEYDGQAFPMGPFMAFLAASSTFTTAISQLARALPDLRLMAADDLPDVLPFMGPEVENPGDREKPGTLQGGVEMAQLTFRYGGAARPVLDGVTISAKPGEFIALVGRSGCGKSTVVKLLLGMEKPSSGGIFYDGHNLSRLDVVDVRSQIGVVMQNADLIPGTIFDYITASRSCTLQDAWAAARLAGVDEVIRNLPMGMFTFISEGSSALSGGQMQRLMIARAMAGKPKLLFFDEATSWLDNETQGHVVERLSHLQITRVVIAHRLSTIQRADRIYVLDEGRVAASGTYDELMSQGGLFADLARRQLN